MTLRFTRLSPDAAPPERRALSGDTLVLQYRDALQEIDVRTAIRESRKRSELYAQYEEAFQRDNPDEEKFKASKDQKQKTKWSYDGLTIRFEIVTDGIDCDLDELPHAQIMAHVDDAVDLRGLAVGPPDTDGVDEDLDP